MDNHLQIMADSYQKLFEKYGHSPKSLGWDKGKQLLRFQQLCGDFSLRNTRILDVGCGFGDFNRYLEKLNLYPDQKDYEYWGIDIVDSFIQTGQKIYSSPNIHFIHDDFLQVPLTTTFDYVLASGTFNLKIDGVDGYEHIERHMHKMFSLCTKAIAIDFISDKVDFQHAHNFNSSPERILAMAYSLSRNVILKNNFFPFEFAIIIYKDDSFRKETTVFTQIEKLNQWPLN